jgi:hypothetical protein
MNISPLFNVRAMAGSIHNLKEALDKTLVAVKKSHEIIDAAGKAETMKKTGKK